MTELQDIYKRQVYMVLINGKRRASTVGAIVERFGEDAAGPM